jgi:hypothetical protein
VGSGRSKARKLSAILTQLEQEGAPLLAEGIRELVQSGAMSVDSALEAIEAGETLAKAELTDEQASDLISQMAESHATGRKG